MADSPAALLRQAASLMRERAEAASSSGPWPVSGLRALTVRQPWAGCIAHLDKRVENRTWACPPRFIGTRIAIHAASAVDDAEFISVPDGDKWATLFASTAEWDAWRFWHLGTAKRRDVANWPPRLALGVIVATAVVTGCHYDGDAACNGDPRTAGCLCSIWAQVCQHHWQLSDVRPLAEPVPCKGMLGLWTVPEEAESAIREQLEADRA